MKSPKTSSRLETLPPYLFTELDALRKKQKPDIITLSIGDPDIPTPEPIVASLRRSAGEGPRQWHRYPHSAGSRKLREAISKWHMRRHGIRLDIDSEILVLIGSKEGIAHLPLALTDPGDTVLVPDPCYPPYRSGVMLAGAKTRAMPLERKNGFLPDISSIPGSHLSKAKLMFLNYPNNPTGAAATVDFYREVVSAAGKHSFWIAQDAAYSEIYFDSPAEDSPPHSILEVPGAMDVAVEFHSLSKTFSMAGWRVGWVCGNSPAVKALAKVKENIDSGVFTPLQEAAVYALDHSEALSTEIRKEYSKRREFFVSGLKNLGWDVFDSKATFYLWARPPGGYGKPISSAECCRLLVEKTGIMVSPGNGFGPAGEGYVRFSLTAPFEQLREALNRIKESPKKKGGFRGASRFSRRLNV